MKKKLILNKKDLSLRNQTFWEKSRIHLFYLMVIFLIGSICYQKNKEDVLSFLDIESHILVKNIESDFSKEEFIKEIEKYNFRFPEIIYAQAVIESGNFKSPIFKDNNNLFGMKQAVIRLNIAQGSNRGHAVYSNWRESVADRALYEQAYTRGYKDRGDYFEFLDNYYAEDANYVPKLIKIIKRYEKSNNYNRG